MRNDNGRDQRFGWTTGSERGIGRGGRTDKPRRGARRRRLWPIVIESLEDRTLLSTYTVTDPADSAGSSSDVTLPYAITRANANPNSTIDFSVTGTITLTSSLPALTGANVTINGPGASSLKIQKGGPSPYSAYSPSTAAWSRCQG